MLFGRCYVFTTIRLVVEFGADGESEESTVGCPAVAASGQGLGGRKMVNISETNKVPKPRRPCTATTRTGGSCQNHPVRGKMRCRMHGGTSTGPRTAEGRERIAAVHFKHGKRRRALIAERKRCSDIGREIQMEIDAIEKAAIAHGWLTKDWSQMF